MRIKISLITTLLLISGCSSLVTKPSLPQASLIIKNGQVITMDNKKQLINNGVVVINNDTIVAVGDQSLLAQYHAARIIDAQNGIVMPGMINTHNHLPMIAFRGLGEEGIENRLFAYFFPLESEKLSRELIYQATRLGAIDLAQSGVTTFADMHRHSFYDKY